jgi:hypothetical protein
MPASTHGPTPVAATEPPAGSLLAAYTARGRYTDCFGVEVSGAVSLAEFVAAFYGSPLFRLERWLLARLAGRPTSRADLLNLAEGRADHFAVWRVESRRPGEILLAAGPTRSWLGASAADADEGGRTTLRFGSAIERHRNPPTGALWSATVVMHRLYARALLAAAARRLRRGRETSRA